MLLVVVTELYSYPLPVSVAPPMSSSKRPFADIFKGKKDGMHDQDPERSQTPPLTDGSEEFSRPLGPPPPSKGSGFQVPVGMG